MKRSVAAARLVESAGRHQELCAAAVRSRRPRPGRRLAYGGLWDPRRRDGFAEGELNKPSDKFVGGKSTMGLGTYFGPGTPPNTDWHHYMWTIVATDLDPKALQPGMTRDELAKALEGHVKGSAGLVTRFRHPT